MSPEVFSHLYIALNPGLAGKEANMAQPQEGECIVCGRSTVNTACGAYACEEHLHADVQAAVDKAAAKPAE
jgi:hypothetical protein